MSNAAFSHDTPQHLWDERLLRIETKLCADRLAQYEAILGEMATGLFILEPALPGNPDSLEVTLVNQMGVEFFGRNRTAGLDVLEEANH